MKAASWEGSPAVEEILLPPSLERRLAAGHPWIYRDHVPDSLQLPHGSWVRVRSGRYQGYGLWDADSALAVRVFSRKGLPDAAWVKERVETAYSLRAALRERGDTTAYRWIFGEGDGLPGIIVDLYGAFAVVVLDTTSVLGLLPSAVDALRATAPLQGIVRRHRREETQPIEVLWGRAPPRDLIVSESGLRFRVDIGHGQKTGLFFDHRDNRRLVESLCAGRRVLDLFSYSGSFGLHAIRGGAVHVTSVDSAAEAVSVASDNWRLNGFDPDGHDLVVSDAFEYLAKAREEGTRFDVVVTDPPSFARSRAQLPQALKAYERLHERAIALVSPGGLYAAASCSTQVDAEAFRRTLADGARRAERVLQVMVEGGQASDHPYQVGHPEGRYLKFVVGRVLGRS